MKILLFTDDINQIGGIETAFYNLSQFLAEKGHEVGVRYRVADPFQVDRFTKAGVSMAQEAPEACDLLIIGSMWGLPSKIVSKLVIQQAHADWSDDFWGGANVAIQGIKATTPRSDLYLAVSRSGAEFVKKHTHKPVFAMNNIAPKPQKIVRKADRLVIAAFTRMTNEKGLSNYVALKQHLENLGVVAEYRVYTNGFVPNGWLKCEPVQDITTELSEVAFVASLADTESFGFTIAEANSCGVPAIIKRANSTAEFFDSDSNVIVDSVTDITIEMFAKPREVKYSLDTTTREQVAEIIGAVEGLLHTYGRKTLRSLRYFFDIDSGVSRDVDDIFSAGEARAEHLVAGGFAEEFNGRVEKPKRRR